MKLFRYPSDDELDAIVSRPEVDLSALSSVVNEVLQRVKSEGDAAVRAYEERFDHVVLSDIQVREEEFAEADAALSQELKAAIEERFGDVRYMAIGTPVWKYFHHLHYTGHQKKLFGYFHDKKLEVFAFSQKRFKFCNSYTVSHVNDALYFLLFVWEQLALDQENDELYVAGDVPGEEWLTGQLRRYVQRVSVVPSGSGQMPYDLSLLCREIQKH